MSAPAPAQPKPSLAILASAAAVILALPIIIGLQTLYHGGPWPAVSRQVEPAITPPAEETYAWIDREKGIVRIPIERAMELIVAESAAKP
ncbi:MAG: hypothetical protein PVJ57_18815 [Phycisphaerae bacterium]|jgi:hypothetical protein